MVCFLVLGVFGVLGVLGVLGVFGVLRIDVRCVVFWAWVWGYGSHRHVCFAVGFCGVFHCLLNVSVGVWFRVTCGGMYDGLLKCCFCQWFLWCFSMPSECDALC